MPVRPLTVGMMLSIAVFPAAVSAAAGDFSCRNTAAEITCTAQACAVNTTGFTPIGATMRGNSLEVCAYSGCWSGMVDLRRQRGSHLVFHANLAQRKGGATLVFDRRKRTATLLWGNYALPMSCGE